MTAIPTSIAASASRRGALELRDRTACSRSALAAHRVATSIGCRAQLRRDAAGLRPMRLRPAQAGRQDRGRGGGINAVADTAGAGVVSPSKQEKKGLLAFPSVDFLKFEGGLYSVQGSLTLRANADEVYAVLLDFEDSHNIFESIEDTQVVMSGGNVQKLNQVCRWRFAGVFSGTFDCSLTVEEDRAARSLVFSLEESTFMRHFQGEWQVHELTGEGEEEGLCRVDHKLTVAPVLAPPRILGGGYTRKIFVKQVEQILVDLRESLGQRGIADLLDTPRPPCDS